MKLLALLIVCLAIGAQGPLSAEPKVITRTQLAQFSQVNGEPIAVNLQHISTIERQYTSRTILTLVGGQKVAVDGEYDKVVWFLERNHGL